MITDKPEELEARAAKLEADAREQTVMGESGRYHARQMLAAAERLRERAAQLRRRRTDGVRFG
jgi:hypothetical protein